MYLPEIRTGACQYPGCPNTYTTRTRNRKYCEDCRCRVIQENALKNRERRRARIGKARTWQQVCADAEKYAHTGIPFEIVDGEVWRNVVGFEGLYRVSNLGRIHNVDRDTILVGNAKDNGLRVRLHHPERAGYKSKMIARLVLEAFRPRKSRRFWEVMYVDGNRWNCHLSNLEWRAGRMGSAKLKESDIPDIWAAWREGLNYPEIARVYGVHKETIGKIIQGLTWTHVSENGEIKV